MTSGPRLRADAVFAGGRGSGRARHLGRRALPAARGQGRLGEVAYAEYVLSAKNAPPDSLEKAVKSIASSWRMTRPSSEPYVLAGRLLLALRQKEAALSKLDVAVALNPKHELAQALIEQERGK